MLQLGNPCAARKDPKRPKIPCATTKTQHGQINIFEKLFKECGFTLVNIDTFGFVSWLCYLAAAAASAKSLQSCPTLCDPMDGSLPGSSVPGIFQARVLDWGAIAFSSAIWQQLYPNCYICEME